MSTSIPKELFDKAAKAVFDGTALSLEHSESVVRIVLDAIELEASAKIISLEAELAKLRELEAENREQYQIALRAKNERIKELEAECDFSDDRAGEWARCVLSVLGQIGNAGWNAPPEGTILEHLQSAVDWQAAHIASLKAENAALKQKSPASAGGGE